MVVACVCAKPNPKPDVFAYSAPLVAAPLATSSAVVSSEFHFKLLHSSLLVRPIEQIILMLISFSNAD